MKSIITIVLAITMCLIIPSKTFAYSTNNVSVKVFQDKSFLMDYSDEPSYINATMRRVNYPFVNKWAVSFDPSYYNISGMPLEDCPLGYFHSCTYAKCGNKCQNNSSSRNHHKNFDYNSHYAENNYGYSGFDIMLTVSAAELCHLDGNGNHSNGCLGLANDDNAMCKLSTDRGDPGNVRVIQHEFSHLFGCGHCGSSDPCIMSGGFDSNRTYTLNTIWCDECTSNFNRTAF